MQTYRNWRVIWRCWRRRSQSQLGNPGSQSLQGRCCSRMLDHQQIADALGLARRQLRVTAICYPAAIRVIGRTEVYRQIAEVRIDGKVKLTQPIGYAFPAGAVFSTALRQGDRFARVSRVYDQQSWDGVTWYDGLDPSKGAATATYDTTNYPIEVNNRGAITERWALRFRSGGQVFDFIGQHLGQIASGNVNEDFSPMNIAAGAPYMTIRAGGWGSGWAAGNVLFPDTIGAEAPIDCVRCVQPGSPAGIDDRAWIVQRGDVGRDPESDF
ncbi:hypothetical protein Alide_0069 [Alicycliphilus denitrificans BC]|nr:hypothetical protein Alide_0069 [Alicycliphilus denitrificans BC]